MSSLASFFSFNKESFCERDKRNLNQMILKSWCSFCLLLFVDITCWLHFTGNDPSERLPLMSPKYHSYTKNDNNPGLSEI